MSVTDYIVNSDAFDPEHCVSLLKHKIKKKADEIVESIEGFQMTAAQKQRARMVKEHYDFLENHISRLDAVVDALAQPFESAITVLCTIPGIDRRSAIAIISEIGVDMTQFGSSKRLCRWAGLTPGNNESAGKKHSVHIMRAGVYIKPMLVQAAWAATRSAKSPYYAIKYDSISKRRGKKRAVIALARMLLTAAFHMLSTVEAWNPSDLQQFDMPQEFREKQLRHDLNRAAKLLVANGVVASDAIQIPQQITG